MASLSGYTDRVKVTVDHLEVSADVSDFPVYVDLSYLPSGFFSIVRSDGGDIRVTRSDGTTECAREVVSIDTTAKTGELHFLADFLSSSTDTEFYIYVNGTNTEPGASTTYGSEAVWPDYEAVYHFAESSGTRFDSTSNNNDLTSITGTVSRSTGPTGYSLDLAESAYIKMNSQMDSPAAGGFSWQFWFESDKVFSSSGVIISNGNAGSTPNREGTFTGSTGTWYMIHVRGAGTSINNYVDGALDNGPYVTGVNSQKNWSSRTRVAGEGIKHDFGSPADFTIGIWTEGFNNLGFDGRVAQVRVTNTDLLDADWIATEYSNQNTPTSFYSVGTMESSGGGAAVAAVRRAIFFGI